MRCFKYNPKYHIYITLFSPKLTNGPNKEEYLITQGWKGFPGTNNVAHCTYSVLKLWRKLRVVNRTFICNGENDPRLLTLLAKIRLARKKLARGQHSRLLYQLSVTATKKTPNNVTRFSPKQVPRQTCVDVPENVPRQVRLGLSNARCSCIAVKHLSH